MIPTSKFGDKGLAVETLQIALNLTQTTELVVDGDYGNATKRAVAAYCENFTINGGDFFTQLNDWFAKKQKFVCILDAGHGGFIPGTTDYATPASDGKRYTHATTEPLHANHTFYEGVENHIITNMVSARLNSLNIFHVFASHAYIDRPTNVDSSTELRRRAYTSEPYLRNGFNSHFHSFHSNAAGSPKTQAATDKIRGGIVFTSEGSSYSDAVAKVLLNAWQAYFGKWVRMYDKGKTATLGSDYEANFAILRHGENLAKTYGKQKVSVILEEFGFFTSLPEAIWIMLPETRENRVNAAVATILWAMENCK